MNDLVNNNDVFIKMFVKSIQKECGFKETKKLNKKWEKDYRKMGYNFLSREDIYINVCNLLDKANKLRNVK